MEQRFKAAVWSAIGVLLSVLVVYGANGLTTVRVHDKILEHVIKSIDEIKLDIREIRNMLMRHR